MTIMIFLIGTFGLHMMFTNWTKNCIFVNNGFELWKGHKKIRRLNKPPDW